jgi:hypothetical protein
MHKYEEQSVPCGGTDAQGINDSIHTRYLVCMFDVVVRSRCRQMYAVQFLERRRRRRAGSTLVERTERAVASTLPKTWSPAHPCKSSSTDDDFGGLLSHSLCARRRWDGNRLSATRLRDCSCNQKCVHLLRIYTRVEGGEQTVTVAIRARNWQSLQLVCY